MSFEKNSGGLRPEISDQLKLLKVGLAEGPFPGYPDQYNRFVTNADGLVRSFGRIVLLDGPWTVNNHPKSRNHEIAPKPQVQDQLLAKGLELDSIGRPLHPWFLAMVTDPAIGVVTGKGSYWNWGPSHTADAVVEQNGRVLVQERTDTGEWALPGGFVDPSESGLDAAVRELGEETGLVLPTHLKPRLAYEGEVADKRMAQGWPVTSAYLWRVPSHIRLKYRYGADAAGEVSRVAWRPIGELLAGRMFGAHSFLLRQAVELN